MARPPTGASLGTPAPTTRKTVRREHGERDPLSGRIFSRARVRWLLLTLATLGLVARVNAEEPDLVLLAGDYVITGVVGGDPVDAEPIARVLGGLRAPAGVV